MPSEQAGGSNEGVIVSFILFEWISFLTPLTKSKVSGVSEKSNVCFAFCPHRAVRFNLIASGQVASGNGLAGQIKVGKFERYFKLFHL